MIGFVLAAGFGTRLRPLTDHLPKALVPVCGTPLLKRNLDTLTENGMVSLGVNTHHLADQVYSFRDVTRLPFEIFHEKDAIRGTGGALDFARAFLDKDDTFCIVNVDILSNVSLRNIADRFLRTGSICALITVPPAGNGTIVYDPETAEFEGLPADYQNRTGLSVADFIGIALYRREVLEYVAADDFSIIPVWKRLRKQGLSISVFVEQDIFWYDTGVPSALAKIHFDFLDKKISLSVPETMVVDYEKKTAYPGTLDTTIADTLGEYVWTDSTAVAKTARIRRSVVLADARIDEHDTVLHEIRTVWGGIPFV